MHFIIVFGFADNTRSIRLGQLKCERTAAGLANSNRQKQFIMHSNLAKSDHSSYYGISIRITFCYGFHWLQWNVTVLLNKSLKALHTYSASRPTRDDSCHGNRWQVLPVVDSSMWYHSSDSTKWNCEVVDPLQWQTLRYNIFTDFLVSTYMPLLVPLIYLLSWFLGSTQ